MVINAYERTWKVAHPILLAGSTNYRKLFSWHSFSRGAEILMSKTIWYFFWYILCQEDQAEPVEKHQKMLRTWKQESSERSYDWIFPQPVTARNLTKSVVE